MAENVDGRRWRTLCLHGLAEDGHPSLRLSPTDQVSTWQNNSAVPAGGRFSGHHLWQCLRVDIDVSQSSAAMVRRPQSIGYARTSAAWFLHPQDTSPFLDQSSPMTGSRRRIFMSVSREQHSVASWQGACAVTAWGWNHGSLPTGASSFLTIAPDVCRTSSAVQVAYVKLC